jgi:DNA-directed RNA polymerase specialized sigma24 family protein
MELQSRAVTEPALCASSFNFSVTFARAVPIYSMMNATDLLDAYRERGSDEAFAELVRRYTNLVYSVALRRLGNSALAEEVGQEVFTQLARAVPRLGTEASLVTWLHRTTVHVSIDVWRSETRRRVREEKAIAMEF